MRANWQRCFNIVRVVLITLLMSIISACPTTKPQVNERREPTPAPFLSHTVKYSGETLAAIAGWYTGNVRNWEKIVAANPRLDPKRLKIGTQIQIPQALVVKREPMPKVIPEPLVKTSGSDVRKTEKRQEEVVTEDGLSNGDELVSIEEKSAADVPTVVPTIKAVPTSFAGRSLVDEIIAEDRARRAMQSSSSSVTQPSPSQPNQQATKSDSSSSVIIVGTPVPMEPTLAVSSVPTLAAKEVSPAPRQQTRDDLLRELLEE